MKPELYSVAIELTAHCNQKCDYCYNGWREDDGAAVATATTAQLLARVHKLVDAFAIDHVTLTGGEPFARGDIWQLLDLLAEHGVAVQIISNGGLITERVAERLAPYGVRYVQVTLNGPNRELHEEHVGPGHFEPTLRGVRALRKHGVPVVGCVVVTHKNASRLGEILELWRSLDVHHIALSRFSPAGYAVSHAAKLLPTLGDMEDAFGQALPHARDGMRVSCTMPIPPCMIETSAYAPIEFGTCPIGTTMQELALGPDGKLRNCTLHASAIGGVDDILDPSVDLSTLIAHSDVTAYRKKLPAFCEGCVHADTCGGGCGAASVWMLGEHSERRLPDPFLWQHVDDDFEARLTLERNDGRRRLEVIL
ncbi:MAG TPA: radical SAM protein [Polyangiaceae bacterium]|nr:radical SAM protein [Polyangiaceae bacterium]